MSRSKTEVVEIKNAESTAFTQNSGTGSLAISQIPGSGDLIDPFTMAPDWSADLLVAKAADAVNMSDRLHVGAGLCLLKAKSLCQRGEFESLLRAAQIASPRASELMAIADVLQRASPEDRKRLMRQPKTALIGLARMDDEIRQKLLETGVLDERLTLTEYHTLMGKKDLLLKQQGDDIKRLKAQVTAAELTGRKALDVVTPLAVAQLRREAASYAQDALACIHGFVSLAQKLAELDNASTTQAWVAPVSLSLVSLLQTVHEAAAAQLSQMVGDFELNRDLPEGPALMMATPGPEEAAMIREAMTGVLIDFGRRHASLEYGQYLETRDKVKSRGRPKNGPGSHGGA